VRVRDVACHVLEAPLSRPFGWSLAEADRRTAMLVEVTAEDGATGWGESYGPARANAAVVEHHYGPRLLGADPLATELIWQDLYALLRDHGRKGLAVQALSGVDVALRDLKGRLLDQARPPAHGRPDPGTRAGPTPPGSTAAPRATRPSTSPRRRPATPPRASRR
jgi:hypothetical protein